MTAYVQLKARLFARMQTGDIGIVPHGELPKMKNLVRGCNRWLTFGSSDNADYDYVGGGVRYRQRPLGVTGRKRSEDGGLEKVSVEGTLFDDPIMGVTAAAAVSALHACGQDPAAVESAVRTFERLPHRMQRIGCIKGVEFVNDSKATNLAALNAALVMSKKPVRLIAGGTLKEGNLKIVKELLAKKVTKVYVTGKSARLMVESWEDAVQCCACPDLEAAVRTAWREARRGDCILLSPGCASFDQFRDFEDRGNQFTKMVESIGEEK